MTGKRVIAIPTVWPPTFQLRPASSIRSSIFNAADYSSTTFHICSNHKLKHSTFLIRIFFAFFIIFYYLRLSLLSVSCFKTIYSTTELVPRAIWPNQGELPNATDCLGFPSCVTVCVRGGYVRRFGSRKFLWNVHCNLNLRGSHNV